MSLSSIKVYSPPRPQPIYPGPANKITLNELRSICGSLQHLIAGGFKLSPHLLSKPRKGNSDVSFARQIGFYIAQVELCLSFSKIATVFECHRSTVKRACETIEDMRDDPDVDFLVECLSRAFKDWLTLSGHEVFYQRSLSMVSLKKAELKILKNLSKKNKSTTAFESKKGGAEEANIRSLQRKQLIEKDIKGEWIITSQGRAHLKRALCEIGADAYQTQHRDLVQEKSVEGDTLTININESPISRLYKYRGKDGMRILGDAEYIASERLRKDFEMAQMNPKLGLSLSPKVDQSTNGSHMSDALDRTMEAKKRVNRALDCVGQEMGGLILDVCCFLKGLETVEKERKWPARSAKVVLGVALRRLAGHYGYSNEAIGKTGGR